LTLKIKGATGHITGKKSLFSSLSSPDPLPSIPLADGSKVSSHGVSTAKLFPSLTIYNVLYVPESPFNLWSISRLQMREHASASLVSFSL